MNDSMNEFFTKVKVVAQKAGEKTVEAVDVSKLRLQCVSVSARVRQAYEQLGKMAYYQSKNNPVHQELYEKTIAKIDEDLAQLKSLNEQIDAIKETARCPKCGEANPQKASYCQKCGEKLEK